MSVKLINIPDKVSRRTVVLVRWEIQKFRLIWPQSLVSPTSPISWAFSLSYNEAAPSESGMSLRNV